MKDLDGVLARRPANCLLEIRRLKKQGINVMINWEEDLAAFLEASGEELIRLAKIPTQ